MEEDDVAAVRGCSMDSPNCFGTLQHPSKDPTISYANHYQGWFNPCSRYFVVYNTPDTCNIHMPTATHDRLCNQIGQNICKSMIAKKHDLKVTYANHDTMQEMGIQLYSGSGDYPDTVIVKEYNFLHYLRLSEALCKNINTDHGDFQFRGSSTHIFNYLQEEGHTSQIKHMNPYKERYNTNNDCFISMRFTDTAIQNLAIEYYFKALQNIQFDHLYIYSDEPSHPFVAGICNIYPNTTVLHDYDEKRIIQFGSTNKHVILSHDILSAMIGYVSYHSTVYYPKYERMCFGDKFFIPGWSMVDIKLPSYTTYNNGRLCNQLIRNICTSMIAKKHNLKVIYANHDIIEEI